MVGELASSVQQSQIALEQTAREHFMSYFTRQEDTLVPDTQKIRVSYMEQNEKKEGSFFVPTASLLSHNSMALDEVSVTLRADLQLEGDLLYADFSRGGREGEDGANPKGGDRHNCEVELKFKNRRPAEGVIETVNMLNKSI